METFEFTAVAYLPWSDGNHYPSFEGNLGHSRIVRTREGAYIHVRREAASRDDAIAWAHGAAKAAGGEVERIIDPPPPGMLWAKSCILYRKPNPARVPSASHYEWKARWDAERQAERAAKEAERAAKAAEKEAERVAKMSPKGRQRYELNKAREAKLAEIAVEAEVPFGNAKQIITIMARRLGTTFNELIDKV